MENQTKVKAVAYARISTLLGQDSENQLFGIRKLATDRNMDLVCEYVDEGVSGRKDKRPALDNLVRDARMGKFKVLIVHSIDRLGRSVKHLLNLLSELSHYGVTLISIRESLDFSTPTGHMALVMLSSVAELESQLISERIKTSLAVKRQIAKTSNSGWKCGRPGIDQSLKGKIFELRKEGFSIREIARQVKGVSKSSVSKILKGTCP